MVLNEFELQDLGSLAKALIELHLENPEKFAKEKTFNLLIDEYERMVSRKLG